MSKPNKQEIDQQWRDIAYILNYTFGEENVSNESRIIKVKLDHKNPAQRELFHQLVNLIGESFLEDSTFEQPDSEKIIWVPGEGDDPNITLRIPKGQNPSELLETLKHTFGNQRREESGKISLQPKDSRFLDDLDTLTGVEWRESIGGTYGQRVLEPILTYTPSDEQRAEQELLLAEFAIPRRPNAKVKSWLQEQRNIEQKNDTKPETAMAIEGLLNPDDQLIADKLHNSAREGWMRREAKDVFSDKGKSR